MHHTYIFQGFIIIHLCKWYGEWFCQQLSLQSLKVIQRLWRIPSWWILMKVKLSALGSHFMRVLLGKGNVTCSTRGSSGTYNWIKPSWWSLIIYFYLFLSMCYWHNLFPNLNIPSVSQEHCLFWTLVPCKSDFCSTSLVGKLFLIYKLLTQWKHATVSWGIC